MAAFLFALLAVFVVVTSTTDLSFGLPSSKHGAPLAAAGIRRAFFLDVFFVGVYFSDSLIASKKAAIKKPADFVLLTEGSGSFFGPDATLALVFKRPVSSSQVAGTLKASLSASVKDKKALTNLADIVAKGIGAGVTGGDTLDYVFNGDKCDVTFNGKVVGTVHSKEIKKAILMAYVGENSVAPEIPFTLTEKFLKK